jgi:phage-related protein
MANDERHIRFLESAQDYIAQLSVSEKSRIDAHTESIRRGEERRVNTKQLRGPIRELIVGNHRITYFTLDTSIYFVSAFRKKSRKTPRQEIEYVEKVYALLNQQ